MSKVYIFLHKKKICFCFQEFKEGRRASATAPQVLFSRDPPRGLVGNFFNLYNEVL
jgi:hypothetical protein